MKNEESLVSDSMLETVCSEPWSLLFHVCSNFSFQKFWWRRVHSVVPGLVWPTDTLPSDCPLPKIEKWVTIVTCPA